jgi:hypothetical protein
VSRSLLHYGEKVKEDEFCRRLAALRRRKWDAAVREGGFWGGDPWTQKSLARRIGVHAVTLSLWESGSRRPGAFVLFERWAKALGGEFSVELKTPEVP